MRRTPANSWTRPRASFGASGWSAGSRRWRGRARNWENRRAYVSIEESVNLTMMIWDLLGQEGYTSFHTWTFQGVYGAILVADLTRRETLDNLERYWIPAPVRGAGPRPPL